jgi:hypothetical protein
MFTELAIGRIIAGLVIIVDKILAGFVTVTVNAGGFNADDAYCGLGAYSGGLTDCGEFLVANVQYMVAAGANIGASILPALGIS